MIAKSEGQAHATEPLWSSRLITTAMWVFTSELSLMIVFHLLNIEGQWYASLLDAGGLTLLTTPMFYRIWFRPMMRQLKQMQVSQEELLLIGQAVEKSPAPVIITNSSGIVVYVNPEQCKRSGYSREELIGKTPRIFKSGKQSPGFYNRLWKTISSGKAWSERLQNKKKDGSIYWEQQTITPIFNEGVITHYLSIRIEDTERLMAEEALRVTTTHAVSASQAKSNFLANMSHEIRTPMNGVLGILELLSDADLTPPQQNLVQIGQESASGLLHIINDILDISKIEAGQIRLESIPVNLDALFKGVIRSLSLYANNQNTTLHFDLDPSLPQTIWSDPVRLKQIVLNLLNNAVKFTPGGEVHLKVLALPADELWLSIAVEDNGPGIPKEGLERLFSAFEQADVSTTREFGGTGLGLTIAKALALRMGGQIVVESVFGEGATFTFTLPIEDEPTEQSVEDETLTLSPVADIGHLNLLVVEDNSVNQLVAQRLLIHLGHSVTLAENGEVALRLLDEKTYDLIFMDFQMPVLDGYETTRRIRASDAPFQHIPIIGLSADVMPDDQARALDAGMNAFLAKPVSKSSFQLAIDSLFNSLQR